MYVRQLITYLEQYELDDEVKVSAIVDLSSFDEDDMKRGYTIINANVLDIDEGYDECPTIMAEDVNYKGGNIDLDEE